MIENEYDELGQLTQKKLHDGKQLVDYSYNIRAWLTGINKGKSLAMNRLFGMELYYQDSLKGSENIA